MLMFSAIAPSLLLEFTV